MSLRLKEKQNQFQKVGSSNAEPSTRRVRQQSFFQQLVPERSFKSWFTTSIFLWIAIVLGFTLPNDFNIYQITAMMNLVFAVHLYGIIIAVIVNTDNLHFLRVRRKPLPGNSFLFIPYDVEAKPNEPMYSISSIIGLEGTNLARLGAGAMYPSVGLCLAMGVLYSTQCGFGVSAFCMFGLSFGFWLIATFQWEGRENQILKEAKELTVGDHAHQWGVNILFLSSSIACAIQQPYIALILFAIAVINLVIFFTIFYTWYPRNVHYKSVALIGMEMLAMLSPIALSFLAMYNLSDQC
eukprot:202441_1